MKRLRKVVLFGITYVAACLAAASCVVPFQPLGLTPAVRRNYAVGEPRAAVVGEPIFRVQQALEVPFYVTTREYRLPGSRTTVPGGSRFVAVSVDKYGRYRLSNPAYNAVGYFVTGENSPPLFFPANNPATQGVPVRGGEGYFSRVTEVGDLPGAFTGEMIYSGLAGTVVRAVYREYSGNLARPAFSQELQYDMAAERIIAYKSLRIRVLEATNTQIRYEVLDDGGLPWLPRFDPATVLQDIPGAGVTP